MSNAGIKQEKQERPEVVTLTVHDLNNLGCGVARMPDGTPDGGLVVFVKGAVTGDVVKAQIIKRTKSFCVGKLTEIITPRPCGHLRFFAMRPRLAADASIAISGTRMSSAPSTIASRKPSAKQGLPM